ncbi:MAG: hypothetical protein ACTIIH_00750 [Brevibacterium sp.]|uniref:hypothetical protein n=1 Tax=Brevibacterium sp. TaxID=1701 RepID=UPI003F9101D1
MAKACVNNLFVSLDGFAAGEFATFDQPIGEAQALFSSFNGRGIEGVDKVVAPVTADRALFAMWGQGIGAEIMGRKKFGPQTGPWPDDGWRGWWGEEPPFKTPCFVLTHHPREQMEFDNGTSFHFVNASPTEALAEADLPEDSGVRSLPVRQCRWPAVAYRNGGPSGQWAARTRVTARSGRTQVSGSPRRWGSACHRSSRSRAPQRTQRGRG